VSLPAAHGSAGWMPASDEDSVPPDAVRATPASPAAAALSVCDGIRVGFTVPGLFRVMTGVKPGFDVGSACKK
jgi:hypothetical protein